MHYVGANGWTHDADYTVDPSWKATAIVAPMGSTYSWNSGTFARVVALFPDGSEAEVSPAIWLDPP